MTLRHFKDVPRVSGFYVLMLYLLQGAQPEREKNGVTVPDRRSKLG